MDTNIARAVGEILRSLPEDRGQREVGLQRLIETYAALEAVSALRTAAVRSCEELDRPSGGAEPLRHAKDRELLADVLSAASTAWSGRDVARHPNGTMAGVPATIPGDTVRAIASPAFLGIVPELMLELRGIALEHPRTGACTIASAMQLWMWTMTHVQETADARRRDAVTAELADAFCALLAARCQILRVVQDGQWRVAADAVPNATEFFTDLCHVQAARSAETIGTLCAELVFGYRHHPAWDAAGCSACFQANDLDELEGLFPGIASSARAHSDVIEADGSHVAKAGPCAGFEGLDTFTRLRTRLDGCLTGARLAKDRAAEALPRVLSAAIVTSTR